MGVARALFEPLNTLSKKTHKTYLQLPNHKTKQKEKKRNTVAIYELFGHENIVF